MVIVSCALFQYIFRIPDTRDMSLKKKSVPVFGAALMKVCGVLHQVFGHIVVSVIGERTIRPEMKWKQLMGVSLANRSLSPLGRLNPRT